MRWCLRRLPELFGGFIRTRDMGSKPETAGLPKEYMLFLRELKERIRVAQVKAVLSVNRELIALYWDLGRQVLERGRHGKWGTAVIAKLPRDIRAEFPDIKGFSPQNILHMRAFYRAWTKEMLIPPQPVGELGPKILQQSAGDWDGKSPPQAVAGLPWGHNIVLVEKLRNPLERLWYARQALQNGWSRSVLVHQIESRLHLSQGKALTNLRTLPAAQSDLAQEVLKDDYTLISWRRPKICGSGSGARLARSCPALLVELGKGFAFVGRQYHLEVGGEDFI